MSKNRSGSSPWSGALALGTGLALGLASGACDYDMFVCSDDADCANGDVAGVCQDNGWCSFSDPTCASDQRYGEFANDQVAGTCVPTPASNVMVAEDTEQGGLDGVPSNDATETDPTEDEGTTGDTEQQESSSSGPSEPPFASCPDDPALVLCLNFESVEGSTVYDDADPTIAGELVPGAEIVQGMMGNALSLPGDGGHLTLGNELHPTGSFSVEAWFRLEGPPQEWVTLIDQWADDEGFWLGGSSPAGGLTFWVDDTNASIPSVPTDQWILVTATHDAESGEMRLYLNGLLLDSKTHHGPLTPTTLDLKLGQGASGTPGHGQIDGVRLWNRVLSPEEI